MIYEHTGHIQLFMAAVNMGLLSEYIDIKCCSMVSHRDLPIGKKIPFTGFCSDTMLHNNHGLNPVRLSFVIQRVYCLYYAPAIMY